MSRMISLLDLDPASYAEHPIHGDERTYSETNCYVDCLVELVHAAGLEADAMMGGAVAADFELDQWTFFKPSPDDLFRLYGIDLHEVQPYRGFPTLIATRLAAGQTVMPEVDSFYLPDVSATAYRTDHVKSTIIAESIDEDARVLRYFHNTGYHELSGEDYDKLFATYSGDGHLPTYVELLRLGAGPVPTGDALKARGARAAGRLPGAPPGREPVRPFLRPARGRPAGADRGVHRPTTTPTPSTTRGWSAPRWSCWPATCGGCSARTARRPPPSSTTWSAARRCCSSGWPGSAPSTWPAWSAPMAEAYDAAVTELDADAAVGSGCWNSDVEQCPAAGWPRRLRDRRHLVPGILQDGDRAPSAVLVSCAMRQVLEFERLTPEPGPRRTRSRHEYVARMRRRPRPASSRSAGSPPSGTCWWTARSSASGRSMFERHDGRDRGR